MLRITRRRLFIAIPLLTLLLIAAIVFHFAGEHDLKARASVIKVGMPRERVEEILGPPVITLRRSSGKGVVMSWVDQLWQVNVVTGPDDRVESLDCVPSDSFLRRTVGRLVTLPK